MNFVYYLAGFPIEEPTHYLLADVGVLVLLAGGFMMLGSVNSSKVRMLLVAGYVLVSGPSIVSTRMSFFGMWIFMLGVTMFIKFRLLERYRLWVLVAFAAYFLPWMVVAVSTEPNGHENWIRISNYSLFIIFGLMTFYVLFEEEIRDLLAANRSKDDQLAQQSAEIARLEPLSVLGERVSHVAHSFKNNLTQVGIAVFHMQEMGDVAKATAVLEKYTKSMTQRIDNILLISRSSASQDPEDFDAARALSGIEQVYLNEPAFLHRAKIEFDASETTMVHAVLWDFLLLAENILKNALEALTIKGGFGTIRIRLAGGVLTISNDGGAMPLCSDCKSDCLDCPRYGKPGRTTKVGGTGHGLAQVFAACRRYGWKLRIRTKGEWTHFEVRLSGTTP